MPGTRAPANWAEFFEEVGPVDAGGGAAGEAKPWMVERWDRKMDAAKRELAEERARRGQGDGK